MCSHPLVAKSLSPTAVPALLCTGGSSRGMFGSKPAYYRPLIAVDGSAASMHAVEHVIAQVSPGDARVHLINVQPRIMSGDVNFFMSARMVADMRRAAGERALRRARSLLAANHIEHTSDVVFGEPVDAIVRYAAERGCTKIVMGTKNRNMITTLLARSVVSRVVRRAHVPVTLVKERAHHASGTALPKWRLRDRFADLIARALGQLRPAALT